jgi:2-oxoglutarate ferredoxin oxidoreductase subunit delta
MRVFARTPIDLAEVRVPHGQVYLIPERCKGCGICINLCPQEVLQISSQTNVKGYHLPEIAPGKEHACVHCEFCSVVCPEFAIFTLEADE